MDVVYVGKERGEKWTRIYPFDASDNISEIQRAFLGGRMDVLFNLVDDGKVSIGEAAKFAGLTMEEAEDMLFGWREAQEM